MVGLRPSPSQRPSGETSDVEVTTLPNGMQLASDSMESVETVSLGVWVATGTRNEPPEINGISHLLEHMAFKGTQRRSARDIAEEIEAVGGQLNAYTGREQTAYYAKVLKEDVPLALDILADILQHSVFDEEELARERAVVLQEIGQANDTPDDIIFDHFQETAYPGQPLGRPVLGSAEIVRALPRRALVDYLSGEYGGSRMVLAAAGRIDHRELVARAGEVFRDLPVGSPPRYAPARYTGGDFREDRDLEQVHIVLGLEGLSYGDPDYYALQVFSTLLGGGMSSRLFQEVREKRGLVYSVHSFSSSFVDAGSFGIYAGTGERELGEMLPVVCDELRRAGESLGEAEVARARAQLKASVLMALESPGARCEQLAHHLMVYGRPMTTGEVIGRIEAVDRAATARVAARLLASRPTVATLGPHSGLESYDAIAARLA
jgi:predicted Zn-dependent peptidase